MQPTYVTKYKNNNNNYYSSLIHNVSSIFDFAIKNSTISLMNFHCSSNPFQLALVSLRRETFSAEITKFNKKKEKKKLSLESLRDRPNWITIVSSVDGKIRGERSWENKIANFETKLSMEIFGRIGIHFKNEITARNLRKARTRCFRVRYT